MNQEGKTIAGVFSMTAFAGALVAGLGANNPPLTILVQALVVFAGAYVLGLIGGIVIEYALMRHMIERTSGASRGTTTQEESSGSNGAPSAPA